MFLNDLPRFILYLQAVLLSFCILGVKDVVADSCRDDQTRVCQYEILESVRLCRFSAQIECGLEYDPKSERLIFKCGLVFTQRCDKQTYTLTIWVVAESDEERMNRIVSQNDWWVISRTYMLVSQCETQKEEGINEPLNLQEDCEQVILKERLALTDRVGSSPGIQSILHHSLEDGVWGACSRLDGRNTKIEIDVHQMETKTQVIKKTYKSKELKIIETDAHERLHCYDWKMYGSWAGDAASVKERHDQIYAQDNKIKKLIGESPVFWEFQCGIDPARILLWRKGWGHRLEDDNYCVVWDSMILGGIDD